MPLPLRGVRPNRLHPRSNRQQENDKILRLDQLKDLSDDRALQDREPVVLRVVPVYVCPCLEPTDWVDPLWELALLFFLGSPASTRPHLGHPVHRI
jgi:hypothetical protein